MLSKILRAVGLVGITVLILVAIIASTGKRPITTDSAWVGAMTMGDTESPQRHYVMYTDLMCPYCDVFTRATMNFEEEFEQFLADNHIMFEVRMTDYLYYNGSEYSAVAAEGAYCAADDGKFWEYYHGAVQKLWDDYHSKGIGDSKTSPAITDMTNDWWLEIGESAGLSDNWQECVKNNSKAAEIKNSTMKFANSGTSGLPYFDWNGTSFNGLPSYFSTWDELEAFLATGL